MAVFPPYMTDKILEALCDKKTDLFREMYQAEFEPEGRPVRKSPTGRMTFDEKFVFEPAPPAKTIPPMPKPCDEIRTRQLDAMRKQHNAMLNTLNEGALKTFVGKLMADMERRTVDAIMNGVMGDKPEPEKPLAQADYTGTERRIMAHMKNSGEVTFPLAADLEIIFPTETDHFPNGSSRLDVLRGKAAPTDFCGFFNPTGLRDCIMASEIGRSEAPSRDRTKKSPPRR